MKKHLKPDLPPFSAAAVQIEQIISNILLNARDALAESDTKIIRISTFEDSGSLVMEIEDSGCGISEENQAKVFDPFFTTKGIGKGTGLGLSLSYAIVESNGGKISVESKVGMGTTFRVAFDIKAEVYA